MSAVHRYDRRDFEAPNVVRVTRWMVYGAMGVVSGLFLLAFHLGAWMQELDEPRVVYVPIKVAAPTPLTQWTCTSQERQELIRACAQRARSSMTVPK